MLRVLPIACTVTSSAGDCPAPVTATRSGIPGFTHPHFQLIRRGPNRVVDAVFADQSASPTACRAPLQRG